jgi:hypothetical protein
VNDREIVKRQLNIFRAIDVADELHCVHDFLSERIGLDREREQRSLMLEHASVSPAENSARIRVAERSDLFVQS